MEREKNCAEPQEDFALIDRQMLQRAFKGYFHPKQYFFIVFHCQDLYLTITSDTISRTGFEPHSISGGGSE